MHIRRPVFNITPDSVGMPAQTGTGPPVPSSGLPGASQILPGNTQHSAALPALAQAQGSVEVPTQSSEGVSDGTVHKHSTCPTTFTQARRPSCGFFPQIRFVRFLSCMLVISILLGEASSRSPRDTGTVWHHAAQYEASPHKHSAISRQRIFQ